MKETSGKHKEGCPPGRVRLTRRATTICNRRAGFVNSKGELRRFEKKFRLQPAPGYAGYAAMHALFGRMVKCCVAKPGSWAAIFRLAVDKAQFAY